MSLFEVVDLSIKACKQILSTILIIKYLAPRFG